MIDLVSCALAGYVVYFRNRFITRRHRAQAVKQRLLTQLFVLTPPNRGCRTLGRARVPYRPARHRLFRISRRGPDHPV